MSNEHKLILNRSAMVIARFDDTQNPYQLQAGTNYQFVTANSTAVVDWILVDITNGANAGIFAYFLNYRVGLALNPSNGLDYVDPSVYTFSYSIGANGADTIFLNFAPGGLPIYYKLPVFDPGSSFASPASGPLRADYVEAGATAPIGCTFRIQIGMHYEPFNWRKARES